MIKIICKKPDYEYDVHSLVKAFYPAEELEFMRGEEELKENVFETTVTKGVTDASTTELVEKDASVNDGSELDDWNILIEPANEQLT